MVLHWRSRDVHWPEAQDNDEELPQEVPDAC
jgi:hypothetical protein